MDVDAATTFWSLLALGALAIAVVVVVGRLVRDRVPWIDDVMGVVDEAATWIAWLVAAGAMAGSLYYSEVAHFSPCKLCWYQRICMYPMAAALLVAAIRRDRGVRWYVAPLLGIGALISSYHYLVEWRPALERGSCGLGADSCTTIWFRQFGFVTLPFMAGCGFGAIAALMLLTREPQSHTERREIRHAGADL